MLFLPGPGHGSARIGHFALRIAGTPLSALLRRRERELKTRKVRDAPLNFRVAVVDGQLDRKTGAFTGDALNLEETAQHPCAFSDAGQSQPAA